MSDQEVAQVEEEATEEANEVDSPDDFFAKNEVQHVEFEHRGQTIKVNHYEVTRGAKYQAMEKAALAFMEENPNAEEVRPLPSVLENELVKNVIKGWNLPKPPSVGWDLLTDDELAERILDEVGVKDAIQQPTEDHPEVTKAKNS